MTPYNRMREYFAEHPEELPHSGISSCSFTSGGISPFNTFGVISTPEGVFDLEGNPIDPDDQFPDQYEQ